MADETLAAVGHAQSAVHEKFNHRALGVDHIADGADLRQRQFAGQHDLAQTRVLQELGFLRRADVGLRAGVELDRWHVDFEQPHVLDDQRVHPRVVQLPSELACPFEFVVAQDGVERDKDAAVKAVRVLHQFRNVLHRVVGRGARTERWPPNVDGIGPVVDGFYADVQVAGGGEEFELVRLHGAELSQTIKNAAEAALQSGRLPQITGSWLWRAGLPGTWPVFAAAVAARFGV